MRIVVFTCNYPPLINPRSFRFAKFVKLNSSEHDILVITSPIKGFIQYEKEVIRCGLHMKKDSSYRNSLKKFGLFRFLHRWIWPDDKWIHQFLYLINYLFKHRKKNDLIITVSNPFSSHFIGWFLKTVLNHKWIADIGDIYFSNRHHSFLSKSYEQIVLKSADHIVVNAKSINEHFILSYNLSPDKFSVIPNGIHLDVSKIKHIPSNLIRLSYIGNTYLETREAITELNILIELAKMDSEKKICIQLFGIQFHKIHELAIQHPELIQLGYCNTDDKLIEAYSNTDILINFANKNNPGLPSKLEEYMATGLPILNFIHSENDASFLFLNSNNALVHHVYMVSPDISTLNSVIQQKWDTQSLIQTNSDAQYRNSWNRLFHSAKS